MTHMSFGRALELMRTGHRVARYSWSNHSAYLSYQDGVLMISMSVGGLQAWNPTQADLLAEDWGSYLERPSPMDLDYSGDGDRLQSDNRPLRDPAA